MPKKNKPHLRKNPVNQIIKSNPDERIEILRDLDGPEQGLVLLKLSGRIRRSLTKLIPDDELVVILDFLDPDKAADLIRTLEPSRGKRISLQLKESIKERVEFLLKFDPRTAAGIMNLDYIQVGKDAEFGECSSLALEHEEKTGKFPSILIVDEGKVIGELPIHKLLVYHGRQIIENHFKNVPSVKYSSSVHDVMASFRRHPHSKVVVLDDDDSVLGIIHSDDILNIIDKQKGTSLYGFTGVHSEEDVLDPIKRKVGYRYRWLMLNLLTAFVAAGVVGLFNDTIQRLVILAAYMPIVAGMGGNAGSQAMAVMVRGLVYKKVELKSSARILMNELSAGFMNGAITGTTVAVISYLINGSFMLGVVFGVSMIINLTAASFFGALIPLIMKATGRDPASSASVFITTATDVIGFFVFLGLASILL